jgi:hypothetical protein
MLGGYLTNRLAAVGLRKLVHLPFELSRALLIEQLITTQRAIGNSFSGANLSLLYHLNYRA